ncbi:hypothetical protein AAHC03_020746 [Spirometra sp. Aus1]
MQAASCPFEQSDVPTKRTTYREYIRHYSPEPPVSQSKTSLSLLITLSQIALHDGNSNSELKPLKICIRGHEAVLNNLTSKPLPRTRAIACIFTDSNLS